MSQTIRERQGLVDNDQIRNVTLYGGSRHRPLPRRLHVVGRVVWNTGLMAGALVLSWMFLVLVLGVS